MSKTNYPGIDYGLGRSNVDTASGIRYGLIAVNSEHLNPDATGDIFQGEDLCFADYVEDIKKALRQSIESALDAYMFKSSLGRCLDQAVEDAFDAIEQEVSDNYTNDSPQYLYEKDGYKIQTSENDFWVLQSPFYTYAQFCSPCAPGAGNLDNWLSFERDANDQPLQIATTLAQNKTFCLGHDWFENGKAPYPIFAVETGKEVLP